MARCVEFLDVDGSYGEGGGQILRTALSFSVITGKPVRVSNIRAGRESPGLKRQHVSSLKVLGAVFDSKFEGVEEGSSRVTFIPGPPRLARMSLDMQTAASITLVLQAVVPAAALVRSRLELELIGGTDVPWSPTYDYYDTVVRKAFSAMGISFSTKIARRGYYPRGGGRVTVVVEPCHAIRPLRIDESPKVDEADVISRCGMLPIRVAERQLASTSSVLEAGGLRVGRKVVTAEQADSPGSSVLTSATGGTFFLGSDELGEKGKPAEQVGRAAAERFLEYVSSGACVDDNLADMIAPLLSLAPGPSAIRVAHPSRHLDSSFHIAKIFTDCNYSVRNEGNVALVTVVPG
ncbi:MAG TPA: RNA 3'-terminal phosphate cyclase [Nitrososphaerales archaeon]|nr:RNA 3'-terminal phosphate cyclase [Nitrososphaerales archaeon]